MEKINWTTESIEIKDLIPAKYNPRKWPDNETRHLTESIDKFSLADPLIINKNNTVIGGHFRLKILKEKGISNADVRVPNRLLDEAEEKELNLRLNKNLGDWDYDLLADFDENLLADIGFESDELDKIFESEHDEKDDEIPENVPATTKLGDLYKLGNHRLLCGDSTKVDDVERLMDGKKADMVFTDPPYGVDYSGGIQFTKDGVKKDQRQKLKNDDLDIYEYIIPIIATFCDGACYVWFADTKAKDIYNAIDGVGDIHALIIWKKNGGYGAMNAHYKQKHEPCLYWKAKGKKLDWHGKSTENTIWEIDKDGVNKLHPTQKPVALAEKAIRNHSVGLILDLFLGSGSTLIACEKTNRICYGMELDPKYCDVIVKRWEDYTGQKAVKHGQT